MEIPPQTPEMSHSFERAYTEEDDTPVDGGGDGIRTHDTGLTV